MCGLGRRRGQSKHDHVIDDPDPNRSLGASRSTTWGATSGRCRTHQTLAVVCALVCFGPPAIAAVVHAGNVRTRLALGDLEGARRASRKTQRLCWASAVVIIAYLLVVVLGAGGYSEVH